MPPETQWARDLAASMKRGDINQMSFGFQVLRDEWEKGKDAGGAENVTRTLIEVKLFDVSVVTFPAYPTTSAGIRDLWGALAEFEGDDEPVSDGVVLRIEPAPETIIVPEAIVQRTSPEIGHLRMDEARRKLDRYRNL
jgi:hypothetical protein